MDYEEARRRFEEERTSTKTGVSTRQLDRQRARGRRHVMDRIEQLVDKGSWLEFGEFARGIEPMHRDKSPRDGTVTGLAKVHGRSVAILGDGIATLGGTQSIVNKRKVDRILEIAVRNDFPIISPSEGGGVRLPDGIGVGFGRLCNLHKVGRLSTLANWRRRPLFLCGIFGFTYGDPAFRAAMADFTAMTEDASAAVSAPAVLEAAISERVSDKDLGAPGLHAGTTGIVDIVAKTEVEAVEWMRRILHMVRPPEESTDPCDRSTPVLENLVPHNNRLVYDMRRVITEVMGHGEWLEMKTRYGAGLITGLGRLGGRLTGVLASQPMSAGVPWMRKA